MSEKIERMWRRHEIARHEAAQAGDLTFNGVDCVNGHGRTRYVSTAGCVDCNHEKSVRRYREDGEAIRRSARHRMRVHRAREALLRAVLLV